MAVTSRCGYVVERIEGTRVTVMTPVGPLYLDAATYDRIDDDAFERFMTAWILGDYAATCVALGEPDPRDGLKHLAEANERERQRQAETAQA